jgi:hypothetical protein
MNSLLKSKSVNFSSITGTVSEATVGQLIKLIGMASEFLGIASAVSVSEDDAIELIQKLVTASPEILTIIDSMVSLQYAGSEIQVSELPFPLVVELLKHLQDVNSDFFSLAMNMIQGIQQPQAQVSSQENT